MIIICDIDGTIADNNHREGFIQGDQKDWDAFYRPELIMADKPIQAAEGKLQQLVSAVSPWNFYFLTGRPERTRGVTTAWLDRNYGISVREFGPVKPPPYRDDYKPQLVMRGDTDRRHAVDYKRSFIEKIYNPGKDHTPILFIDDDLRNKNMYLLFGVFLHAPACWEIIQ